MQKTAGGKMNTEQIHAEIDRILDIFRIVQEDPAYTSPNSALSIPDLWEIVNLIDRQQKHEEILRKLDEISK